MTTDEDEQEPQIIINIDMNVTEAEGSDYDNQDIANEEDEKLTPMHYAESIAEIDYGCLIKSKVGVSGEIPDKDSFPFFKSSKKWTCLMWGGSPDQWRLLSFDDGRPDDIYDTEESFKATYIMLSGITEVFLELFPSASFRIYQGQEVTRCTPAPESRDHAEMWVNAIYAAMQVQAMEYTEEVLELRNRFIDAHEADEDEEQQDGDEGGYSKGAGDGEDVDLENGEGRQRSYSGASHGTTKSAFVDMNSIYGWKPAAKEEDGSVGKGCCIVS